MVVVRMPAARDTTGWNTPEGGSLLGFEAYRFRFCHAHQNGHGIMPCLATIRLSDRMVAVARLVGLVTPVAPRGSPV